MGVGGGLRVLVAAAPAVSLNGVREGAVGRFAFGMAGGDMSAVALAAGTAYKYAGPALSARAVRPLAVRFNGNACGTPGKPKMVRGGRVCVSSGGKRAVAVGLGNGILWVEERCLE